MINKIARHTVHLSIEHDKPVKLLHLNRIVFFAIGLTIRDGDGETKQYIKERYDNGFSKEINGAIAPTINARFESYGDDVITNDAKYFEELRSFDDVILRLLDVDPDRLTKVNLELDFHRMWADRLKQGMYAPNWLYLEIAHDFTKCDSNENYRNFMGNSSQ